MRLQVLIVLCLVSLGCGSLLPTLADAESYTHKAAVLCLRIEVIGEGARRGWLPDERAKDRLQAVEAYDEWHASGVAPDVDPDLSEAIATFEASWPSFLDDSFDVAFRCRQMVARLRSYFHVTTLPSMPID